MKFFIKVALQKTLNKILPLIQSKGKVEMSMSTNRWLQTKYQTIGSPKLRAVGMPEMRKVHIKLTEGFFFPRKISKEKIQTLLLHETSHMSKKTRLGNTQGEVLAAERLANRRVVKKVYKAEGPEEAKKFLKIMKPMTSRYAAEGLRAKGYWPVKQVSPV